MNTDPLLSVSPEIRREVDGFTTSVTELMTPADGLEAAHMREMEESEAAPKFLAR